MKSIIFNDTPDIRAHLLPLTFTRPACDMRVGIYTIREKWEKLLQLPSSTLTETYLNQKFPCRPGPENLLLLSNLLPSESLIQAIRQLQQGEVLVHEGKQLAALVKDNPADPSQLIKEIPYHGPVSCIRYPWEIFQHCGPEIEEDFRMITANRVSAPLSATNKVIGDPSKIFLEADAVAEGAVFNTTHGPVYLAAGAEVMEGCLVRGPFALGEHSKLKMGAKIYGPASLGPHVKAGGELNDTVIFGYSNKAHDGFLGHAVIGEWCNLGADTNNSNLKNNYANVKIWNYPKGGFINTGLQFCGLIMGDHSKCGINTMFNTGTVVGVSANIFGDGFPRNFIPSFSWGGAAGFRDYDLSDAVKTAELVYARRGLVFNEIEKDIFSYIFSLENK